MGLIFRDTHIFGMKNPSFFIDFPIGILYNESKASEFKNLFYAAFGGRKDLLCASAFYLTMAGSSIAET